MRPYIFSNMNGIHILDLRKTQSALARACDYLCRISRSRLDIVFVGTKRPAREYIESEARRCGAHFVNHRWLGGTITNYAVIRERIKRLNHLENLKESGELFRRPKKELAATTKEFWRLEGRFGGVKYVRSVPAVLVVVDQARESLAIKEAKRIGCTVIALVDTDGNPDYIDFLIPGNDDSMRSINLILRTLSDAIIEGRSGSDPNAPTDTGPYPSPAGVPRVPLPVSGDTEIALSLPEAE